MLTKTKSPPSYAHGLFRIVMISSLLSLAHWSTAIADGLDCVQPTGLSASLCEKDLAIALPHTNLRLPQAKHRLPQGGVLLPEDWYRSLHQAYEQTSVGSALYSESRYDDWRVVSMRVAPCAALGKSPRHRIDEVCWPEVRLVWQPIIRKIILHVRFMEASADDRAIHAIYPVNPAIFLAADDAAKAQRYLAKIAAYKVNEAISAGNYLPLNPQEMAEFKRLRDSVTRQLLADTQALRSPQIAESDYQSHGLRPEFFQGTADQDRFLARLSSFLERYAEPTALGELTSFSLPEGRQPAHLDEWVFIAFNADKGQIVQQKIPLHSFRDGRLLFADELAQRGTMGRDDDAFYDFEWTPGDQSDVYQSVILTIEDVARLRNVLVDRRQRLVANTSCVSCHKLNDLAFDFHNFSYLEDREITISPRVVQDVALDLLWIKVQL